MPRRVIKTSQTNGKKSSSSNINIEKALIENFIALQKVLTNLSIKFDGLSTKITKLLDLFELSAKALAEKDLDFGTKEISDKMDKIMNQNKTLAQGIALLHGGEENYQEHEASKKSEIRTPEIPKKTSISREPPRGDYQKKTMGEDMRDYEISISSKSEGPNERQNKDFP